MATGIPYLGSKISLISKSEIRYEGILYTIDTKESTVALAKVRSYGTEDRPTDRPVAPRDETYEYIIFRGADIKDIRVCQPPKPRPTLEGGLPNDPAIVQHSRGPPGGPVHIGGPPGPAIGPPSVPPPEQPGGKPPGGPYGPIGSGPAASAPPGGPFSRDPAAAMNSHKKHSNTSPVMDLLREGQSGTSSPAAVAQGGRRPSSGTSGGVQHDNFRRGRGGVGVSNRGGGARGGSGGRGGSQAAQRGGGGVSAAPTGQVSNRGRGGFQPGRPSFNKKDTLKFDSEYDFEQANEEFKEFLQKFEKTSLEAAAAPAAVGSEKAADEVEDGEIVAETGSGLGGEKSPSVEGGDGGESAPVCYDKAKSFFDSISCEASERQKGKSNRPDWKAEKKLNRETFGVVGRRNYYGGYGRGGRGGYRGYYGNGGYGYGGHGYGGGFHNRGGYSNGYGGNRQGGRGGRGGGWHQYDHQAGGGGRGRGRGGSWRTQAEV